MPAALAERLLGEGTVLLALIGWWAFARHLPEFILPGPLPVARRLAELFITPDFLRDALTSTWRVLVSIALALIIGGGLAFLAHGVLSLEGVVDRRIKPALNSFSSIGWAILAAIWFEPTAWRHIRRDRNPDSVLPDQYCRGPAQYRSRAHGDGPKLHAHRARVLLASHAPYSCPMGFQQYASPMACAWKIALVAELLGATNGLGYLMLRAQTAANSATFLATCFCHRTDLRRRRTAGDVPLERALRGAED